MSTPARPRLGPLVFAYALASYLVFLATFLYAIGFVGNLLVPRSIDSPALVPLGDALLVNLGLLGAFAVQHSLMARPAFKRGLVRVLPAAAERSTYVLASSLALLALFWFWQPMGGVVWDLHEPFARGALLGLYAFGWCLVLVSTFLINHADLFGLRQAWLYLRGRPCPPLAFDTPGLYRLVRHPLYLGWLFAFWATPTMTVAHLVFALMTTAYIVVAIQLEENDLLAVHPEYADYRRRVPMLIPNPVRKPPAAQAAAQHLPHDSKRTTP
ncbi:membrane protein [Arenimonas soli]|uniref:methanethiol S-methyltransferase n=1 Tax=Arenimonas soli TaxID=2269504 RepID=A0ABQ1HNX7_9GAMM|nr:methanethiol S-methyltransferase [Arenimonas soli]GGA83396.1 membrane protein [Arenimonas soli]